MSACICFHLNILNWDVKDVICSKRNRFSIFCVRSPTENISVVSLVYFIFLQLICLSFLISTGYGECLLDEPVSRPYSLSQQLPGQIYNVNKQCELIFGPGTQVCPYMVRRSLKELQNILAWASSSVYYLVWHYLWTCFFNRWKFVFWLHEVELVIQLHSKHVTHAKNRQILCGRVRC